MAGVSRVHAYLMRAAGAERHIEKRREPGEMLLRLECRHGLLSLGVDAPHPLAALLEVRLQRQVERLLPIRPATDHQREIALLHVALAELSMEAAQNRPSLCDQQTPAGLPVEAMHELQLLELRVNRPQRLDDPETHT